MVGLRGREHRGGTLAAPVFRVRIAFHIAGVALLALPHLIAAPNPELVGGPVPPELAGGPRAPGQFAGVALLALPHLIAAPNPELVGGPVPPELAGQFVAASLATSLVFWAMLGWFAGKFYERFVFRAQPAS